MTGYNASEDKMNSDELLPIVLEMSGSLVWTYDIVNNRVIQNIPYLKKLGVPEVIEGGVDFMVRKKLIHPDSLYPFLELHEAICRGEPEAKTDIRVLVGPDNYRWYSFRYYVLYDDETCEPEKAIGLAVDVNAQKEIQIRGFMDALYRDAMLKDTSYIFEVNVSQNKITKPDLRLKKYFDDKYTDNYRDLLEAFSDKCVEPSEKFIFRSVFSRETMLESFKKRNTSFSHIATEIFPGEEPCKDNVVVNLTMEPINGDICALIFSRPVV